jgi:DNA polymerase, archaea type
MTAQLSLFGDDAAPQPTVVPRDDPAGAILFGWDLTERIVAVEASEAVTTVYRRLSDGTVASSVQPFVPWIVLAAPIELPAGPPRELEGDGAYRLLYEFADARDYHEARSQLRDAHVEHVTYPSLTRLALIRSGQTLFKGMAFSDIVRMQIDLETEGLSPDAPENRILLIAVRDNRGLEDVIAGEDEREMMERLVALVRERDPDVIEGHNIYGFDLPFLAARAQRHGVRLTIGRDGSEARTGQERNFAIGGNTRPFRPVYIHGRHVIDTYLAVQRFDAARGALSSYGLKEAARAFGIAAEDRIVLPREEIGRLWVTEPERVRIYAQQDVLETARLAEMVSATDFYQTQMVPDGYGAVAVGGTGEKINLLMLRAYLRAGHAIPRPLPQENYPGGYTDIRATGVLERVVKADVESLYPSIMLTDRIRPRTDTLDVFLPALSELTRRRIEAKARVKAAQGAERHYWDGLQGSFKVLINSFYGYLGAPAFHFNDPAAAGRVTVRGQELVRLIASEMERTGSRLIEIDTDGVYFVPPADVAGPEAEQAYVEQIGRALPQGIRLAFDGRYRAMLSLKTKNYVLLAYDGTRTFKGASLRSRADEPFGREFLSTAIDLLLERRTADLTEVYARTVDDLIHRRVPIEKLARRERVTEKTRTSAGKQRSAAIAGSTAVGEYITVYERSNGQLGLLDDYEANGRDEDAMYYVDKLYKFACRLREAIPEQFDAVMPRPTSIGIVPQAQLDLFG